MTNFDLEKIWKDKGERKQAIGAGGGGLVGGIIGGFPGMQIGMAIGGYLFKPDEPRKKDYFNPDYKIGATISRIDSVPDVIGTDIAPGKIIYFNEDVFGVYDKGHMPSMEGSANEEAWKTFATKTTSQMMGAMWAEFAVNFAGKYSNYHDNHIGVVKINGNPFWFWVLFSDWFENSDDPLNPYHPLVTLDAARNSPGGLFNNIDIETQIEQDVNFNAVMYYKGYLTDFSAIATDPSSSNFQFSIMEFGGFLGGLTAGFGSPLEVIPTFTAEVNSDDVWLSPESMHGGAGMPGYASYYNNPGGVYDPDTYYNYGISMNRYWSCRDAKNNNYVGVAGGYNYQTESYEYFPIFLEGSERKWDYAITPYNRYDYYHDPDATVKDYFRENIISPSYSPDKDPTRLSTDRHYNSAIGFLQCTDVIDNRVYICTYRNWMHAQTTKHHHAGYGVKFDIYYHDRSSPYQEVHSLLYDYQLDNQEGAEGCNPSLHFGSMQVDADYVYIFGSRNQTDIVLTDKRSIEAGENSYVKIYCDLSQYDNGFWVGYYAALSQNQYKMWREIIEQTSTYIVVAKEFAAFPVENAIVKFSKYPQWVSDWGIIGAINSDTEIICNSPEWNADGWLDSSSSGLDRWNSVFLIGKWLYGTGISKIEGSKITLSSPFDYYYPKVGDRICFEMAASGDHDRNYTDPNMTEEYAETFYDSLGFDYAPKADLQYLWASRISGNEFGRSHHVCWRIDKVTGSIEVFDTERVTTPTYYVGPLLTFTGDVNIYTCATDKQAFVYSHESQYGTQMAVYSYVIDFDSESIVDTIHRRNQFSGGHTPAWCYMGCVLVKEWDAATDSYVNMWYTVCRVFDSHEGLRGGKGTGTYFLKLTEGKFSNTQVISDNINLYWGVTFGGGVYEVLYRPGITTGPLYNSAMYLDSFPDENSYQIGKFGITEDIYFYVEKNKGLAGTAIGAGPFEMWRYTIPTEENAAGELYCIAKSNLYDEELGSNFQWLEIHSLGSFKQCRYGFYGNGTGRWYQCDTSPPDVIYNFFRHYDDPRYIDDYFYLNFNFDDALEICNEIIDATIYTPKEHIDLKERRFAFSQCYDQPIKFVDALNDVLDTCQGFLSICVFDDGKYKMIVPNPSETPVHYFGLDSAVFVSTQLSDDNYYIYGNFSAYPDNYWKGDLVYFDGMNRDWSVVIEQTSTYIVIGDWLSTFFPDSKQFTIKKDNIKEGSFTFAEKSEIDRPNKVRIEFKNRLNDYIKEVAEAEDTYRLEILGEVEKIDFYKMHGIKRATQAGRMAMRILDQWNYQRYVCGFETDLMGMTLCMGEIIGVSHATTGWNGKWFRIVAMEELMDFEVKFELEEFNPYCYHDYGVPVFQGHTFGGFPKPYVPRNVERLEIKEDIEFNRLYFTFKAPEGDAGYFAGARVYRLVDGDWEFMYFIHEIVSSVLLAQDVGLNDTTIYYDNDTLSGSFPAQGVIWIENELMYYHGIDTVNHAFTNVVRGYKDTDQVEHSIDENDLYIILRDDATLYYEIPESWIGTTQTFKVSASTVQYLSIDLNSSPSADITITGYGLLPYFPESIQNKIPEFESVFESLGLSENTIELTIEQVVEILGLGDSKVVTETLKRFTESLGLGDELRDMSLITIIETLGLGDVKYQPDYAGIIEAVGLGDSETAIETLAHLTESLGLGDLVEVIESITETLGLGDSKIITETLAQLVEALGLGDLKAVTETWTQFIETLGLGDSNYVLTEESITETLGMGDVTVVDVIEYIVEALGLGDSKVVTETLAQLIESLGLGESTEDLSESEDAAMMILNNNML